MKINLNNLNINYEVIGEDNEENVLLIHGFPDSLKLWRNIAPILADQGYKVTMLDLPGFGESDMPHEIKSSRVDNISDIIKGLLDALDIKKTHIVGHDWGSLASWHFIYKFPEYVKSYSALSVGHPKAFKNGGFEQLKKSWYVVLILNQGLAEELFTANNWSLFKNFLQSDELEENWLPDLSREGRLTSAFNIYRANLDKSYNEGIMDEVADIDIPVLAISGDKDPALTLKQIELSKDYVKDEFKHYNVDGGGHWLPLYNYEEITPQIVEFMKKHQ